MWTQNGGRGHAQGRVADPAAEDARGAAGPHAVAAAPEGGVPGADPLRGAEQGGRQRLVPPRVQRGRHALDRNVLVHPRAVALRVPAGVRHPGDVPGYRTRGGGSGAGREDRQDVPRGEDLPNRAFRAAVGPERAALRPGTPYGTGTRTVARCGGPGPDQQGTRGP